MSCCGSCKRGGTCRGNPLTRREAARALSIARKHRQIGGRGSTWEASPARALHHGISRGMRDVVRMFVDRRQKNPNFLRLANRRVRKRRNGGASQNFIYEANGRRRRRGLARDRRGRFKKRGR